MRRMCQQTSSDRVGPGVITPRKYGIVRWAQCGVVQLDPRRDGYVGAYAHTNNTGELTAMHVMLDRALRQGRGRHRTTLCSDSMYAISMTTGRWMPKKARNQEIIRSLRYKWRQLQRARPEEVRMQHVRSHVGIPGNELADYLAGRRTHDETDEDATTDARAWLSQWMTRRPCHDPG